MSLAYTEYKNFRILKELIPLIKHMDPVEESREKLYELSKNWDSLSLLSKLGNAGVDMDKIKTNFTALSSELINHLGVELLKKSVAEMDSKAQVSVDIVIRNLFERTADIGFLATDNAIKDFLLTYHTKYAPGYEENVGSLKKRFLEYVEKYSVYFDIVLINTNGDVVVNIDENNKISKSYDAVIQQTIDTTDEYIETFKYHDFLPQHKKSLVYSYKLTEPDDFDEKVLGVLCLCFKFEDEMEGIFKNLINPDTKECITLLNKHGEVIATSDKYHIPLDAKLDIILNEAYQIVSFGGRDYLAKSAQTNGYQGFQGLGWYGHIMVPLEHIFTYNDDNDFEVTQDLLLSILQNSNQFLESLKQIPIQAENIQNNLNRAIWNGHIKQTNSRNENKQFSKALLQEIKKTGENTKNIIGTSMASLTKTMVLSDSVFLADLILDIMDRNLYERANDCRWWALTPDFRDILEDENPDIFAREKMNNILTYINNLYTVYTNLFIYDRNGIIISVSKPDYEHFIGKKLLDEWVYSTLSLTDTSKYFVSDFEKSPLYKDKHTYIYNASIKSLNDEKKVIGGIGIVFDSESQFEAMIEESLPKNSNSEIKESLFAVLATKDQIIIASNASEKKPGDFFEIDKKFFELNSGKSLSEIVQYEGNYYALGVTCSKGYREYKAAKDEYVNDVYSFVFSYISSVAETKIDVEEEFTLEKEVTVEINENSIDIASFMVGSQWLGFDADDVVEAVGIVDLKSTINLDEDHHFKGTMIYKDTVVSVIDIQKFIQEENNDDYEEIIILKFGADGYIGILVNSLGDIPEIKIECIRPLDEYIIGNGTLIKSVVFPSKEEKSQEVLSILSIEKISSSLVEPHLSHAKQIN